MSEILSTQLENGLKIMADINPSAVSCCLGFFVNTGGRDEAKDEYGLSHFLEHMMFKGTKKRTAKQINDRFGEIGAMNNAYTSDEHTVYYATVLPEQQDNLLELLADMLQPSLRQEDFDLEKKVILEEIAVKKDEPQIDFYMQAVSDYFHGHPFWTNVIGTTESVSALTKDQMRKYFKKRYLANNISLCAAGAVNFDSLNTLAKKYCAQWKSASVTRSYPRFNFFPKEAVITRPGLKQPQLMYFLPGPSAQDELRFAALIWSTINADSVNSRLYWEIIDNGLAESVYCWVDDRDYFGRIILCAACSPETLSRVKAAISSVLNTPDAFTDRDLERAKIKIASRIALGAEKSFGRMISLGEGWAARKKTDTLIEIVERINSVGRKDILSLLSRFDLSKRGVYTLQA